LLALQRLCPPEGSPGDRAAATGLSNLICGDVFERPTRLAARLSRSAGAFFALVDAGRLSLRSSTGAAAGRPAIGAAVGPAGEIGAVIASFVKIGDVATETSPKDHPAVADFKAAAFMSAPVLWGGGHTIGCLCVFDTPSLPHPLVRRSSSRPSDEGASCESPKPEPKA
jgi:hypothetical protein